MIYGGSDAYESKRKQKLTAREINAITTATPKYLKWSEAPITFGRANHPDHVPHPGRYPLVLDPIVRRVKLNRVLIDGGSGLNIFFAKTLDDEDSALRAKMEPRAIPRSHPWDLDDTARDNQVARHVRLTGEFPDRDISFEVADFEAAYHAIL